MTPAAIVSKLLPALCAQTSWNYCNVLHDDGMSYLSACGHAQAGGDYVPACISCAGKEQLTYLLSFKMDDERTKVLYRQSSSIPSHC